MTLDKRSATTEQGTPVGYVSVGHGGYFFVWHSTMDATVATIEEDSQDPPTGRHNISTVQRIVRAAWRREAKDAKRGYRPIWMEA